MPGIGMVSEYDGRIAAAGNRELMIDVGVEFNDELEAKIKAATNKVSRYVGLLGTALAGMD